MRPRDKPVAPFHQTPSVIGNKQLPIRKLVKPKSHARFMASRADKNAARTRPLYRPRATAARAWQLRDRTRVALVMIRSAIHGGNRETNPARTRWPIQFGIGFHEIV